jgi:hypothetical protein
MSLHEAGGGMIEAIGRIDGFTEDCERRFVGKKLQIPSANLQRSAKLQVPKGNLSSLELEA